MLMVLIFKCLWSQHEPRMTRLFVAANASYGHGRYTPASCLPTFDGLLVVRGMQEKTVLRRLPNQAGVASV